MPLTEAEQLELDQLETELAPPGLTPEEERELAQLESEVGDELSPAEEAELAQLEAEELGPIDEVEPSWTENQPVTNKELDHYAKKYNVDSDLLREYAIWAGANTEMREGVTGFGGWQGFKDNAKRTAGNIGNLFFGLNKIAAKKLLSDDPNFRKAADEINTLSSKKQSHLKDITDTGSQMAIGGVLSRGAKATSKLPTMAKKLYDPVTAATGAGAYGLGHSTEGSELEEAGQAAALGALGYGALAGVGKAASKLSSLKKAKPDTPPTEKGKIAKTADKYLGSLSTRIGNISQDMKYSLRKFESDALVKTAKHTKEVEPFMRELKDLPPQVKLPLTRHLFNGEFDKAQKVMNDVSPTMGADFKKKVRPLLEEFSDKLHDAGHTFEKIPNYFPRIVKDYDALRATLGLQEQGAITKQLAEYAKKKKTSISNLSPEEKTKIIDLALQGYKQVSGTGKPKFAKKRILKELDEDMLEHYAAPEEALGSYIKSAVHDIEKRKFFGVAGSKDAAEFDEAGMFSTDGSIGKLVTEAIEDGKVPPAREQELFDLIQARFIGESQAPSKGAQVVRDLGYMGTIANPVSTITQLGDIGVSAGLKGFNNTISSMFGTKELRTIDLGIEDLITKELAVGDSRKTVQLLDGLMRKAGFKAMDRLGKETFLNASLKKARKQVQTPEGERELRQKVAPMFKDETDDFITDLKTGELSENVKLWSFNELADVQPIALSEMPEAYLRAKNGRLLYMLKSFTLKQLDVVRNSVVHEWQRGDKKKAVKQAALLAGYVGAANVGTQTVKDILLGRDVRAEDIPDKALWALLGAYGMNEYVFSKYISQGKIKEGAVAYVTPATPIIDAAFTLGVELPKDDPKLEPTLRAIPFVGPLVYSWFGGGAEKYNKRLREGERGGRR